MSNIFDSSGEVLSRVKPSDTITDFDRRVYESMAKVMFLPDDFKEYMLQYQVLNQQPIPSGLVYGSAGDSYTPTLTASTSNPTLGSGSSQTGRYIRVGNLVFYYGQITFGTSGTAAGSGTYRISLPIEAYAAITYGRIGNALNYDNSTGSLAHSVPVFDNVNTTYFTMSYASAYPVGSSLSVTEAQPWAWAASDAISWFTIYEAA